MRTRHVDNFKHLSGIAAGMMRIDSMESEGIRRLYEACRESGITVFDHADIYGSFSDSGYLNRCEEMFADALALSNAERDDIIIQTKAGIRPGRGYDSSFEHLVSSARASLAALRTDYLDVFLIHRPDALVEPDEVARAFDELYQSGDVRHFGVSNHTPRQIDVLRSVIDQPLVVNQIQVSLVNANPVTQGIAANTPYSDAASRDLGVLDFCQQEGIAVQAWSPLQSHSGPFIGTANHAELNRALEEIAGRLSLSPSAIALAWLMRHPARIQPVVGTTRPERIKDLARATEVQLTREDWYRLYVAAGHPLP